MQKEPFLLGLRMRLVRALPLTIKEQLLFGRSRLALPSQILMSHFVGGARRTRVPVNGMMLECSTSEKYFFLGEGYEREVGEALRHEVTSDDVVYDVGAFIGYWVLLLSGQCRQVFAFEPSPRSFARLKDNVTLNSCTNVGLVNKAASDCGGFLPFSEHGSMSHSNGNGECTVPTIQLDDFATCNPPPNILLIDVEGAAGNVLRGARRIVRDFAPTIICEVHDSAELCEIEASLSPRGYQYRILDCPNFPYHILAKVS